MTACKPYPIDVAAGVPVRPIPGYEGIYSIAEDGRIWTEIRRVQKTPHCHMLIGGKWIKPHIHRGYEHVALRRDLKTKTFAVHRLVAAAWLSDPTPDRQWINHKNGIGTDNRASNLEWCTPRENNLHAYRMLGKRGPGARFSNEQVVEIRRRLAAGELQQVIADEFGISNSNVSLIKNHHIYRNV